ncbi:MAG: hypothetical protein LBU51_10305 [Bacteroidales bacterium]|jgi:hypothetical protein|nr:hypothetical protein [Bacteroidales bacterium]
MNNILSNYPDIINVALIPMIIAIFALSFPLLLQTISRIDDKYNSTKLIEAFRKDRICKWCLGILTTSVASYVIWLCQIPPLRFALILFVISIVAIIIMFFLIVWISNVPESHRRSRLIKIYNKCFFVNLITAFASCVIWLCQIPPLVDWSWIIDNFALILVTISTIALITMVFFIIYLAYIYYVPEKLLNHLIKNYNQTKKQSKKKLYFEAISKILFYSINKADEPLARTLLDFYFESFIKFRKGKESQTIEYPQEYYDTAFEANELLCNRKKKTISYFNDSTLFELFFDQSQKTVISPKTYRFLWKLIAQSILYDRVDFILSYWRKAHQLFNLFMPKIHPNYDSIYSNVSNQAEIDKREKDRNDFLEFHYALGGLLMYKQKYSIIKELMYFTQSQPPKYVLVPEKMQQVIERYMQIEEFEYLNPVYYEQRYQFPDIYGVNADGTIRMWIKRYLSVLFIRQYTLHEYYVNSNTLTMPKPPENLSELNRWKEELDSLDFFVNDYLSQTGILKELGLEQFCNPNWFDENNKIKPSVLIENFIKEIEENFVKIKTEQNISPDKKKEFQEETIEHFKPILEEYSKIFTNNQIGDNYQSHYIGGQHCILEKAAFSNNQDIGYSNSVSITAESVAMQFQQYALNSFIFIMPHKYFLTEKDVFLAIDRLNINPEDFIIISVGLNIDYFSSILKIDRLKNENEKWHYNNMEIVDIYNNMNDLVSQSLFVLKKEDLPNMVFKEIDKKIAEKYHLEKIDETYNIYTGLNDLHEQENEIIRKTVEKDTIQTDLSQKVLACVDINVEIQYKTAKCVQLKAFSQFDDRGTANNVSDVQSIWEV